jgi:CheY-like chemotaxis protein
LRRDDRGLASSAKNPTIPASISSPEQRILRRYRGTPILLVEDDLINREVTVDLLAQTGLDVDRAKDGLEAIERVREHDYALVLMDLQMPGMDGLAATQAIRALPGRANLPILAMTAGSLDDDRARCGAAGMNDFIRKPVAPERLYAVLERWLSDVERDASDTEATAAPASTETRVAPPLPAIAQILMAQLEFLLSEGDARALQVYSELGDWAEAMLGPDTPAFRNDIKRGDYAKALALLRMHRSDDARAE